MDRNLKIFAAAALLAVMATPAQAHEAGQWVLRAGVGSVSPKSNNLDLSEAGETITVEVDSATSLTLTGTYMFTENWALDILAAWPFSHDIMLAVDGQETKVAETDQLPPTFSLQYHFMPQAKFQPYAGLGLNYTTFFNTKTVDELSSQGVDLELSSSFGVAGQLGADIALNDSWLLNVDVRYVDIATDATFDGEDVGTIDIDPWVYSVNVGFRF